MLKRWELLHSSNSFSLKSFLEPLPHVLVSGVPKIFFLLFLLYLQLWHVCLQATHRSLVFVHFMQLLGDLKGFLIHSVPPGSVAVSIASFDILESIM